MSFWSGPTASGPATGQCRAEDAPGFEMEAFAVARGCDRPLSGRIDDAHLESDWPNNQINLVGDLSADKIDMKTWANASAQWA